MSLTRAFAAFSHLGDYKPALEEIDKAWIWLKDVPVTEYTDIQVSERLLAASTQTHRSMGDLYKKVRPPYLVRCSVHKLCSGQRGFDSEAVRWARSVARPDRPTTIPVRAGDAQ